MILWMWGTEGGLCFDFGFLEDIARLLQCLHHAYNEGFRGLVSRLELHAFKSGGPTDCWT